MNRNEDTYISIIKTEMVREKEVFYRGEITNPKDAAEFALQFLGNATRETVAVLSLDAQCRPVAFEIVSVGLLSRCTVGMPEVFRHAILACADAILCFHNHPSAKTEPSMEDIRATKKLKESGKLLGIRLLDHIIVGDGGHYTSLKEAGYI